MAFTLMLACFVVATVSRTIAAITWQRRRSALGWLTLVGDDRLRAEADGRVVTLTLRPGSVRLYCLAHAVHYGQHVQRDLRDGDATVHVWSAPGLGDHDLVKEGVLVQPQGRLVASSAGPLRRWLRPFVTTAPPP